MFQLPVLCFAAMVSIFVTAAPVSAATQVAVFCGSAPLRPCDDLQAELLPKLTANVETVISAFKEGKVLDPVAETDEGSVLAGYRISTPTCDIGQMAPLCGTPCRFNCAHWGVPRPSQYRCTLEASQGVCSLERSWTRGALIALLRAKLAELKGEIQSEARAYSLGARCQALADAIPEATTRFETAKALWDEHFAKGKELPTCATLAPGPAPSALPAPDAATSAPTAAQCLMLSAVPMLSSFAFQAAACELFARTETSWLATEADRYEDNMKLNLQNAVGACVGPTPPFPGPLSQCVNAQYAATIARSFSSATPRGGPTVVPPPGRLNACPMSTATVSPWEPILCAANPATPFVVAELGAMIQAAESLSNVGQMLDAAARFFSKQPVPALRIEE